MKKIVFLFVGLFIMSAVVWAGNDKPINLSDMPKNAQQFIKRHFGNQQVAVAKVETDFLVKSYDVIFTNGDKVEFDGKGRWTNVDCEHSQVPVEIIPADVQKYVVEHYPQAQGLKIELTDKKGYEVELNNGFEIEFDKHMRVRDIDR